MEDLTEIEQEEIARLIKEGFTSGRIDRENENRGYTFVAWELSFNKWSDENEFNTSQPEPRKAP